jgi:hypothetical protein
LTATEALPDETGGGKKITEDQATYIADLCAETGTPPSRVLKMLKVEKIEDILAVDYDSVIKPLQERKDSQGGQMNDAIIENNGARFRILDVEQGSPEWQWLALAFRRRRTSTDHHAEDDEAVGVCREVRLGADRRAASGRSDLKAGRAASWLAASRSKSEPVRSTS